MNVFVYFVMAVLLLGCAVTAEQSERQRRIRNSPWWNGKSFQNIKPVPAFSFGQMVSVGYDFFTKKPKDSVPKELLPAQKTDLDSWPEESDLQFAWLGHTTFLLQLDGKWIITDPVFSMKPGSTPLLSPDRYSQLPLSIDELPEIDIVLVTHNHYDHLDEPSIKALISKTGHFITPLGVGEYLEEWGVPSEKITELDWWENKEAGNISITSAPARHFSGRGLFDHNKVFWTSYAIKGKKKSLYLSGDSGWHEELYEIGKRLGPFDITFFEMGAYGDPPGWKELHYTPEEAVKAHQAVKGKIMIPSHWATFDLAMFRWHEPIERFVKAADTAGIKYLTPKIGERVNPQHHGGREKWWRPFVKKLP